MAAIGLKLPPTALVIAPRTVIVSLILGTTITVAAAISPARRASRVAPIEALRENAAPSASIKRRVIVGTVVSLAGIGALAAGLFGGVSNAGIVVGLGAALTFVGVAMLSPLVARPIASTLGRPFRGRISGKLGGENANRNPRRTASTAAALMIGLGLVAFVAVFAASLKSSVTAVLDRARAAGLRPLLCPEATVVHEVGASSATRADKLVLLHRGKVSLLRKHWRGPAATAGVGLLRLGVGLRAALGSDAWPEPEYYAKFSQTVTFFFVAICFVGAFMAAINWPAVQRLYDRLQK